MNNPVGIIFKFEDLEGPLSRRLANARGVIEDPLPGGIVFDFVDD
jgi:hypothetical protein